jgi:hypothetical protein
MAIFSIQDIAKDDVLDLIENSEEVGRHLSKAGTWVQTFSSQNFGEFIVIDVGSETCILLKSN